jgi:hypothetical protein
MERVILTLYGKVFHPDYENIDINGPEPTIIQICDGIYRKKSTRSDVYYPTLRCLGEIAVEERKFYRGQRFQRKIIQQNDDNVILYRYHNDPENYTYKPLHILCRELGYTDEFITEMTTIIITTSNKKIRYTNAIVAF